MGLWRIVIRNQTGKPLLLQRASLGGLPQEIADGADADIEAQVAGDLDYMVRPGELFGAKWSDGTGMESYALGLREASRRLGDNYEFTLSAAPPHCTSVYVASGSGATICLPDYRQARERAVKAAKDEADKWKTADLATTEEEKEKMRLPLRVEYASAWKKEAEKGDMRRAFQSHSSGTQSWCGVFAVWSVQRAQPTGIYWTLRNARIGGGPVGMLKCTDFDKIHIGDVGHVWDDPAELARRTAAWIEKGAKGSPPVSANHHVLVTQRDGKAITTVEGNAGNYQNERNIVRENSRGLGRSKSNIDFFYCAVPHPRCVLLAHGSRNPEDCPRNDPKLDCPLPDPPKPKP